MPMKRLTPIDPIARPKVVLSTDAVGSLMRMNTRKPGTLARLVVSFRESIDDTVASLWDALARGERGRIQDLTHRLAGASSQMGATDLADACRGLACAEEADAAQRMSELESIARRSLDELEHVVARCPSC
jgi:HPt (histidine-containing phosphotransfer) domain-containing protein